MSTRLSTFAITSGKRSARSPTLVPSGVIPFTRFRDAFSSVAFRASGSMSIASTVFTPSIRATMARIPLPVPMSSMRSPPRTKRSSAASERRVDSCVPVPNAMPGSISTTMSPGPVSASSQGGRTTMRSPTREGLKYSRHLCRHSSPTMSTSLLAQAIIPLAMRAWSSVSKCAMRTVPPSKLLSRVVASRSSTPVAPRSKSSAEASSISSSGTRTCRVG